MGHSEDIDLIQVVECGYREGRDTLIRYVNGSTVEELDWRPNPRAVSIGSQVIHILGFESMAVSAIEGVDLQSLTSTREWRSQFSGGYPRQLGVSQPEGLSADHYLGLIDQSTQRTLDLLGHLTMGDIESEVPFYEDSREFDPEGLSPYGVGDLLYLLPLHDRYHLGQITLTKWLATEGMV